jgi:hypothetical protein
LEQELAESRKWTADELSQVHVELAEAKQGLAQRLDASEKTLAEVKARLDEAKLREDDMRGFNVERGGLGRFPTYEADVDTEALDAMERRLSIRIERKVDGAVVERVFDKCRALAASALDGVEEVRRRVEFFVTREGVSEMIRRSIDALEIPPPDPLLVRHLSTTLRSDRSITSGLG